MCTSFRYRYCCTRYNPGPHPVSLSLLRGPPVFDLAYRDYILSWYTPLSHDEGQLHRMLSDDWRQVIGQLRSRLASVDVVQVVCYDIIRILHTHFTDLKGASVR